MIAAAQHGQGILTRVAVFSPCLRQHLKASPLLHLELCSYPADAPAEGRNKLEYYKEKFGQDRTAVMIPMMTVRCPLLLHSNIS